MVCGLILGLVLGMTRLNSMIALTEVNVYFKYFNAMSSGVGHQIRGCIETHWQAIHNGTAKYCGLMTFEPGRYIDK